MNSKFLLLLLFVICIASQANATTVILDENFDADFTGWTVQEGGFAIVGNTLQSNSADSTLTRPIVYPTGSTGSFTANTRMSVTTIGGAQFCFNETSSAAAAGQACQSFNVYLTSTATSAYFRFGSTVLATLDTIVLGTMYDINVVKFGSTYNIYMNNVLKGTVVNGSDINGTFAKLVFADAGAGFANWSTTQIISDTNTFNVTVRRPKQEQTNSDINGAFDISVNGIVSVTNNSTFPYSFAITDTNSTFTMTIVDNNSTNGQQYYARSYVIQTDLIYSDIDIQPYLIGINDGVLVNLKVANLANNQTVPNIRIQMYYAIGSVDTLVEDRLTDAAGIAQVVMLSQRTYDLLITSPFQDINYFTGFQALSASSQNFTIWIQYTSNNIVVTQKNTSITISPSTTVLTSTPQLIDVNIDTNVNFTTIYVQAYDSNRLVDQNNCSSATCHVRLTLNVGTFDSNYLNIRMVIQNGDVNVYVKNINYVLSSFTNNLVQRVQNLKNELGAVQLGLIMFITIFLVIGLMGSSPLGNNMSQIFIIVLITSGFYFLWFWDNLDLRMPFLAGLFGVILIYFWSRQKGGA